MTARSASSPNSWMTSSDPTIAAAAPSPIGVHCRRVSTPLTCPDESTSSTVRGVRRWAFGFCARCGCSPRPPRRSAPAWRRRVDAGQAVRSSLPVGARTGRRDGRSYRVGNVAELGEPPVHHRHRRASRRVPIPAAGRPALADLVQARRYSPGRTASAFSMPRSSTSSAIRRSASARDSCTVPISSANRLSVCPRAD